MPHCGMFYYEGIKQNEVVLFVFESNKTLNLTVKRKKKQTAETSKVWLLKQKLSSSAPKFLRVL